MADSRWVYEVGTVTDDDGLTIHVGVYVGCPTCWTHGGFHLTPEQRRQWDELWALAGVRAEKDMAELLALDEVVPA